MAGGGTVVVGAVVPAGFEAIMVAPGAPGTILPIVVAPAPAVGVAAVAGAAGFAAAVVRCCIAALGLAVVVEAAVSWKPGGSKSGLMHASQAKLNPRAHAIAPSIWAVFFSRFRWMLTLASILADASGEMTFIPGPGRKSGRECELRQARVNAWRAAICAPAD
jgi:hypothetical protein